MAELTQTKDVVRAVVTAIREAQRIAADGVQPSEITAGLAPGELKDALDSAIDGANQVQGELESVAAGDWRAAADLLAYIAEQVQTLRAVA